MSQAKPTSAARSTSTAGRTSAEPALFSGLSYPWQQKSLFVVSAALIEFAVEKWGIPWLREWFRQRNYIDLYKSDGLTTIGPEIRATAARYLHKVFPGPE